MEFIYNYLSAHFIESLGWTFLHTLWQGGLIALILFIFLSIHKSASANVRYQVSILALFLAMVSAIGTFLFYYIETSPELIQSTQTLSLSDTVTARVLVESGGSEFLQNMFPVLVGCWGIGIILLSIRFFANYLFVAHLKTNIIDISSSRWGAFVAEGRKKLGIRRMVRVAESLKVKTPVVLGYFKPLILLPLGAINKLQVSEVEAILVHELAHIRRNDYLINLFQTIVEILFYYHPAIWFISSRINAEREHCCDDVAVAYSGDKMSLVKALYNVHQIASKPNALSPSFAGKKNHLLDRIKRIMKISVKKSYTFEKTMAIILLVMGCLVLSLDAKQGEEVNLDALKTLPATTIQDTVPVNENITIKIKNGAVKELSIDGKNIPEEEFPKYQKIIEDSQAKTRIHPIKKLNSRRYSYVFPPTVKEQRMSIKQEEGDDGARKLIIDGNGGEQIEIVIPEDGDKSIIVEGSPIDAGDEAIIIMEKESSFPWSHPRGFDFQADSVMIFNGDTIKLFGNPSVNFPSHIKIDSLLRGGLKNLQFEHHDFFDDVERQYENAHDYLKRYERQIPKWKLENDVWKLRTDTIQSEGSGIFEMDEEGNDIFGARHAYKLAKANQKLAEAQMKLEHMPEVMQKLEWLDEWTDFKVNRPYRRGQVSTVKSMQEKLIEDGLIKEGKRLKFSLSNRRMKVNGKRQPSHIHQDYLNHYYKICDCEGKIEISISN